MREGRAGFLQKGLMQTATILKAVVNKQTGIGLGRPMSHVALLELPGYPKLLGVTDGGMIPNPDLEGKKAIAHNAVAMFHGLGYERPLVSAVCAAENVSPKIIETVDAAALKQAALEGTFGPCYVEGPISLDLALSRESAQIKGYESPVTGGDGYPARARHGGRQHDGQVARPVRRGQNGRRRHGRKVPHRAQFPQRKL